MENNHFQSVCIDTKERHGREELKLTFTAITDLKVPGDPRARKPSLGANLCLRSSPQQLLQGAAAVKESKPQSSSRCRLWVPALRLGAGRPLHTPTMSARGLSRRPRVPQQFHS